MKILFFVLLISNAFASTQLSQDWVIGSTPENTLLVKESFQSILEAQGNVLEKIDEKNNIKSAPLNFKFNEMITDIAVTKSGLFGLSALKSNTGVEIKWKRKSAGLLDEGADIQVEGNASETQLKELTASIIGIVESSKKVPVTESLKRQVLEALTSANEKVKSIGLTNYNGWKLDGLRLDLSFGGQGEVWVFAKAGATLRVRMEWKLKEVRSPVLDKTTSEETKFVAKTMHALGESLRRITIPGFDPKKISIGVGGSRKFGLGLWKCTSGFMGYLIFVPDSKEGIFEASIPSNWLSDAFTLGGLDSSAGQEKGLFRRSVKFSHEHFVNGMEKSLKTAYFFAANAEKAITANWSVTEIKTINDISYKGLFGLADFTTKGAIEIDFKKRK